MRSHTRIPGTNPSLTSAGFVVLGVMGALAATMLLSAVATADASSGSIVEVTVIADGQEWEWVSRAGTVGGVLEEAGVTLGPKDRVSPKLSTKAKTGLRICVMRIEERVVVQKEPIAFGTVTKFNPRQTVEKNVIQEGERGEKEIKYLITYKDGVKVGYKVLEAKVTKQTTDEIVSVSGPVFLASRHGSYKRSLRMQATAYDPGPRSCGKWASGYTAIGMRAGKGVVAVDPKVIPLRTKLYVEGYGFCVAGDTGGAIKGNRIDLGFATYREAIQFGRRTVTVYVLE